MSWPNVVVFLGFVYAVVIVICVGLVAGNWAAVTKLKSESFLLLSRKLPEVEEEEER